MGARHEPPSSSTFYLSLATATLRGVLVVAAVVLGVFVLSRAFPTGQTSTVPEAPTTAPETQEPQTPAETGTPAAPATQEEQCPDPGDVPPVQVLNGTEVTGLAADAAARLVQIGYKVPDAAISNASSADYETTVVLAKGPQELAADCLAQEEFRGAERDAATPDAEYGISVILGRDYARRQG